MQYVDSSVLLKRYVLEPESDQAQRFLLSDVDWVTAAHTEVEVRRNLTRRLDGSPDLLSRACGLFTDDWQRLHVVRLDRDTCRLAAELAEVTGARTLDALHLAAVHRAGAPAVRLLTFDVRLAQVARGLGWTVLGA